MRQNQRTKQFLVKSLRISICMICLWLLIQLEIFSEVSLEFDSIAARLPLCFLSMVPFIIYFLSGNAIEINFVTKAVYKRFVLCKIPIGSENKRLSITEMFLIPFVHTPWNEHGGDEVLYELCAGTYKKNKSAHYRIKVDSYHFKKIEGMMREFANRMHVPASIYWNELKETEAVETKKDDELAKPFCEIPLVKQIEKTFDMPSFLNKENL